MIKRKAKTGEMLMELMTAKDHVGIQELFANLISAYNERGCTGEISVLTAMKTEMDDVFSADPKAFLEYIRRYVKKYRGRAFPLPVDYALVIKGIKTNDTTAIREAVEALKKSSQSMQSKVDSLTSKVEQLDKIVKKIPLNKFTPPREGGGQERDRPVPPTFKCRHCGEVGAHWSNLCPTIKEKEGEKDE